MFARLCSRVHIFVWAVEVLPLRRQSPQGARFFVASHPLPLHLTNYCATSTPLMKPGTCPSVLLWAWLVSVYWYKLQAPFHPALWQDFFFRSNAVNSFWEAQPTLYQKHFARPLDNIKTVLSSLHFLSNQRPIELFVVCSSLLALTMLVLGHPCREV